MTDTDDTPTLDDATLAEIRDRVEPTTPGPWRHTDSEAVYDAHEAGLVVVSPEGDPVALVADEWYETAEDEPTPFHDAEFIAHARTDVPLLLAEVERLRAEVDRAELNAAREANDAHEWGCENDALRLELDDARRGEELAWKAHDNEQQWRAEAEAALAVERARVAAVRAKVHELRDELLAEPVGSTLLNHQAAVRFTRVLLALHTSARPTPARED